MDHQRDVGLAVPPPGYTHTDLATLMRAALAEAEAAAMNGDMPIGAVVAVDGEIVSRGRACRESTRNQIAHAELQALWAAARAIYEDYDRALLVTTLEPCPMCLGAAVMAAVPHIVFEARDFLVQSWKTIDANPYVRRHLRTYLGGILEDDSLALIRRHAPDMLAVISQAEAS